MPPIGPSIIRYQMRTLFVVTEVRIYKIAYDAWCAEKPTVHDPATLKIEMHQNMYRAFIVSMLVSTDFWA